MVRHLKGLGEYRGVQEIFADHLKDAMAGRYEKRSPIGRVFLRLNKKYLLFAASNAYNKKYYLSKIQFQDSFVIKC